MDRLQWGWSASRLRRPGGVDSPLSEEGFGDVTAGSRLKFVERDGT